MSSLVPEAVIFIVPPVMLLAIAVADRIPRLPRVLIVASILANAWGLNWWSRVLWYAP